MIFKFTYDFYERIRNAINRRLNQKYAITHFGYMHPSAVFAKPLTITAPHKIFMYENTNIYENAQLIISPNTEGGNFIMKKWAGAAQGLIVITGNHNRQLGLPLKAYMDNRSLDTDKDIIVEEDVWLGANVTLCAGVKVGRGANVGTGSVVRTNIPPYAITVGNPAKVIGFCFTPEEIIEHEKLLYSEEERLPLEKLQKNYQKYYQGRLKEIANFVKS